MGRAHLFSFKSGKSSDAALHLRRCFSSTSFFPWETEDGQNTERSPKWLLSLVWYVSCLLPPAKNIQQRKEVLQEPEPNRRRGRFSLTQQSGNRDNQFPSEATTVVPYHCGECEIYFTELLHSTIERNILKHFLHRDNLEV